VRRAVFLDRDGVLNRIRVEGGRLYPPASAAELQIAAGASRALTSLKEAGFLLIVVTNQPDVARGLQTRAEVENIHAVLQRALPLDDFFVCYHDDADACQCRKPRPGMLLAAAERYAVDLPHSYLVGDRWRDIDAGARAGCTTILIGDGYGEREPEHQPDARVRSLAAAARWILTRPR